VYYLGMRVVLIGYGNMGREVERVVESRGHEVVARVDPSGSGDTEELTAEHGRAADVAIEFSVPDAVLENASLYADLGLAAVVGTTGWADQLDQVRAIVGVGKTGYLHGPNFSVGVHVFYRLVETAVRLVDPLDSYDLLATEIHHKRKKDSPSGTALALAKVIMEAGTRKKSLVTERLDRAPEPDELHFSSLRGGYFPGQHKLVIDSEADTIELTHTARSRSGFAVGAVLGAEWILGKSGFYNVDDFVSELLGG
jgi:4-hydroxy-tetrahydrodipicolinate reductase